MKRHVRQKVASCRKVNDAWLELDGRWTLGETVRDDLTRSLVVRDLGRNFEAVVSA